MTTWKPTSEQSREIRDYAKMRAGTGWVKLELGEKVNTNLDACARGAVFYSPNVMLFTDDIHNEESSYDLADLIQWDEFRKKGVELTDDGCAYLDFYVYDRDGLNCNIAVSVMVDGKESIILCGG
ncbi:hypothetical protein PMW_52 [Pseudomonas phage phiPMW]|uniref:Uncharacterized protein n=1 Tax=Pseudomonas phage phiPMW TaxID=1815582 RepID=A0A1S5R1C1_9CAUD|nr:hypothetical protein FDG97_gp052 [Pseudomonas phage phiPMW]ANA49177.1 hypothetical protein PMW_52 [Pseudomonas phage phiPMW]